MPERRPLGDILIESGRITDSDVARGLEYQQTHGGFFGQALVALGILTREETDWALASQFDLPFIFPNADAIDRDVAHLVPADWALAHMAVPIVRAGRSITVVVADPLAREVVEELSARTGCQIEMALASASRIRELIHAVYDPDEVRVPDTMPAPLALPDLISHALDHGADRFGISVRGPGALGWWRARGELHRAPLGEGWEAALAAAIRPPPRDQLHGSGEGHAEWNATLNRRGTALPLEAQALVGAGGSEYMFRPLHNAPASTAAAEIVLPGTLVMELRLLWRSGAARIAVNAERAEITRALLPLIPSLVIGEHVRAVHVNETGEGGSAYTIRGERTTSFAERLAEYGLDAVTMDLPHDSYPLRELLRAAPLALVLLQRPEDESPLRDWGVNWVLGISGDPGSFAWRLHALHY